MRILYVCTANQCRSPIAERLARTLGVDAESAGVRAVINRPMVPYAAIALKELGGHPEEFLSRQLTAEMISDADLVLTMTHLQRDQVLELNPLSMRKTFTMVEAARLAHLDDVTTVSGMAAARPYSPATSDEDITDPMGRELDAFRATAEQIRVIDEFLVGRITG
jgi:protein-tyrosine phosphatase